MERAGLGDTPRLGMRGASLDETRLAGLAVIGAGDLELSRLKELRKSAVDIGRRGTEGDLAYGEGVVAESGLKLWPTSKSLVLVLEFQRGRLFSVDDD